MAKPAPPTYRWDERSGRYRDSRGRFVSWRQVRKALDQTIANSVDAIDGLAQQLREGKISLQAWRDAMAVEIRNVHAASIAAAKGGWAQMTPADWGRVGGRVRGQLWYLRRFANEIAAGKVKLDGVFLRRAGMYGRAGVASYVLQDGIEAQGYGYDEEMSQLGTAEHCEECVSEAARGWAPIGSLIPIGSRTCISYCACTMLYRNSQTGKLRR